MNKLLSLALGSTFTILLNINLFPAMQTFPFQVSAEVPSRASNQIFLIKYDYKDECVVVIDKYRNTLLASLDNIAIANPKITISSFYGNSLLINIFNNKEACILVFNPMESKITKKRAIFVVSDDEEIINVNICMKDIIFCQTTKNTYFHEVENKGVGQLIFIS